MACLRRGTATRVSLCFCVSHEQMATKHSKYRFFASFRYGGAATAAPYELSAICQGGLQPLHAGQSYDLGGRRLRLGPEADTDVLFVAARRSETSGFKVDRNMQFEGTIATVRWRACSAHWLVLTNYVNTKKKQGEVYAAVDH